MLKVLLGLILAIIIAGCGERVVKVAECKNGVVINTDYRCHYGIDKPSYKECMQDEYLTSRWVATDINDSVIRCVKE